jgi:nitroreductase
MEKFEALKDIIEGRRTTKSNLMNGKSIDGSIVIKLLSLANWAPTHGLTEPWRFIIYKGEAGIKFCEEHAELYKEHMAADKYLQPTYDKLLHYADKASHTIVVYCKHGMNPKIPLIEDICSTACALQNVLLGAETLGIAAYWSTGGMVHYASMKDHLKLGAEDVVIGVLYLGYADEKKVGKRKTGIEEKIVWKS